ncbi:hypothetical protein QR680_009155 [Steinernema hermaphroditum]|uniref:Calcineurin-like phosphoesterase domain-containing protein n=1 Tax=Steinernema hermaphroditum TaxID=289476 RepID=A0AA39ILC3_9BILA|nr:hypothetical protein QR680_009155 [Steinernema hermaphroditum]
MDLLLPSYVSLSKYAHLVAFIFAAICFEKCILLFLPNCRHPVLASQSFHTFAALILALALTFFGVAVAKRSPTVKVVDVFIDNLPPELDGFSIVQLTDIHIGPTVGKQRIEKIVTLTNSLNPHAITIVGDLVDGFTEHIGHQVLPLSRLKSRFGVFYVTGNHEYYHGDVNEWIDLFRKRANLTVLRNEARVLTSGHRSLCIAGVDDLYTEKLSIGGHKMDAVKALNGCPDGAVNILLVHQPNAATRIIARVKKHIDLILSGHTHGGQMYIFWPFAYLRNDYLHGLYSEKGVDCFSNLLEKLARISFIRLLLWNRQFQAVFSLIVSVCISLVCFMSADYIYVRTAELPISNLSPKAEGLRIAVLSDLHAGGAVHRDQIAHVVDRTNDMNADAVFIVGDMTDGTIEHLESRIEPLRHLRSRLGTFMVTGNHDYYFDDALAWIRLFKSYGIKVLTNSKADLEGICLVGLNDISSGTSGIPSHEMNISSVILECEASKSVIVLSHNPASAKHISESNLSYNGVDLIISGHTHSGQFYVMLPFIYFVLPYVHGLYTVPMKFVSHNTILLVTAGTLYQGPPMKMPFYSNIWQVTLMAKRTSEFVDLD